MGLDRLGLVGGFDAVLESFRGDVRTFLDLMPKMALAFLLAALVTSLVSRATIAVTRSRRGLLFASVCSTSDSMPCFR